jgi:YjbE family integral membrane protein
MTASEIDIGSLATYLEVIAINLVLSGDNVIVIGLAAAGLSPKLRQRAIVTGIAAAAAIRIAFSVIAVRLLAIPGVMLIGGLLLLWVCWSMFQELWVPEAALEASQSDATEVSSGERARLRDAIVKIIVADVSMSLDNVLAVSGASASNMYALVFGLTLSVILMAIASTLIANLLAKYKWLGWVGLAIIVYVALGMIYEGAQAVSISQLEGALR